MIGPVGRYLAAAPKRSFGCVLSLVRGLSTSGHDRGRFGGASRSGRGRRQSGEVSSSGHDSGHSGELSSSGHDGVQSGEVSSSGPDSGESGEVSSSGYDRGQSGEVSSSGHDSGQSGEVSSSGRGRRQPREASSSGHDSGQSGKASSSGRGRGQSGEASSSDHDRGQPGEASSSGRGRRQPREAYSSGHDRGQPREASSSGHDRGQSGEVSRPGPGRGQSGEVSRSGHDRGQSVEASSPGDGEAPDPTADGDPSLQWKPKRLPKDPSSCSVLLFPGQGSQFVGMCRGLTKFPHVEEMFAAAQKILGYDLLSLCLEGPEEELMKTVHCQPAVFVSSLAALEKLNHENPQVIESCVAAAGFSVGEFAALVFSGAMTFEEALFVVKVRAEAMQKASEEVPSGMLSVIGSHQARYKHACVQAIEHCRSEGMTNPVCSIANYLFPDARVIAGHQQALGFLQEHSRHLNFVRTKMIPVSGAFHTKLMEPAVQPLRQVLQQVEIQRPEINVYSNVDGKRYMNNKHVRTQLAKQVVSPVKWEQTLHEVYERLQGTTFPRTYEVGPGKQLGTTLHRVNRKAYQYYTHVDVTD